jgi:hypothetical protein
VVASDVGVLMEEVVAGSSMNPGNCTWANGTGGESTCKLLVHAELIQAYRLTTPVF